MPEGSIVSNQSRSTVILERRFVPKGAVIMKQGDQGECAYLIQSGAVRVYTNGAEGQEIDLAHMVTGDIFGEMALVFDAPRTASVQAVEDCNLIVLTRQTFRRKLESSDPTIRAMVQMLSKRILDINNTLMNKKSDMKDLIETVNALYQNVLQSLPRTQQRTFQNGVLPKLDEFLKAVKAFNERFSEEKN